MLLKLSYVEFEVKSQQSQFHISYNLDLWVEMELNKHYLKLTHVIFPQK